MVFDKAEYQRQYMRQKRMLDKIADSVRQGATAEEFDRYSLWLAARKLYGKLTSENWPFLPEPRADWTWDSDHIYQMCEHGRRYCVECGTATAPLASSPEQWMHAYEEMRSAGASKALAK